MAEALLFLLLCRLVVHPSGGFLFELGSSNPSNLPIFPIIPNLQYVILRIQYIYMYSISMVLETSNLLELELEELEVSNLPNGRPKL